MSNSYLDEISDIWKMVRDSFHSRLSRETVDLWFGELSVIAFENNTITLSTNSEFKLGIIKNRHLEDIKKGFCDLLGFDINVEIVFNGKRADVQTVIETLEKPTAPASNDQNNYIAEGAPKKKIAPNATGYTFEYTFDNFIIGASNEFAHAACVAVADRPATNYNPLFIYGPSGLGKTHLMHAIINQLKMNNPSINIIYVKGEDFTNQLVESLKNNTPHHFREKYRKCDVLLIDDIQFIAGKESTQEEFFHTFNSLFEENKQIILTSDRPPRDIKTLEDRLLTRFEWGLIADIQPPDLELRVAIIKKKAEEIGIDLPHDLHMFLAENLRKNVRQIEGSINKLSALSMLSGKKLDMDLVNSFISELLGGDEPVQVTVDKIFDAVSEKYGVSKEEIYGTHRTKEIANARHVTIYLLRNLTDMSFPNIGRMFNRDHSTIMNSIDVVERRLRSDSMFVMDIAELKKIVTGQNH